MQTKKPVQQLDLLDATREASRSAHRWRDIAERQYLFGSKVRASSAKRKKEEMYLLKERGVVALHSAGLLHYAGASPQGMAVYEYGDGGLACLHSTLHPRGAERKRIDGHPETLLVQAKPRRHRSMDVEFTLGNLPEFGDLYERSAKPFIPQEIYCYRCGMAGHIARKCWEDDY